MTCGFRWYEANPDGVGRVTRVCVLPDDHYTKTGKLDHEYVVPGDAPLNLTDAVAHAIASAVLGPYRVEILVFGDPTWYTNQLRFDSEAEALEYAHGLFRRWTQAQLMRIVPADHPEKETYVRGSEHPDWRK